MRRRTFVAWCGLLLATVSIAAYVGLLVQRRVSPPIVAVPASSQLQGYHRGDAVLLRAVDTRELRSGDVLVLRLQGKLIIGRVAPGPLAAKDTTVRLDGIATNRSLLYRKGLVVGRVDRRVPLVGWVLIATHHRVVQILGGFGLIVIVALLITGRATPLDYLDYLDDPHPFAVGGPEPLALPAGPAVWPDWVTGEGPAPDWASTGELPEPTDWPAWVTGQGAPPEWATTGTLPAHTAWPAWVRGEGPPPRWAVDGDKPAGIVAMTPGLLMPYVEHSMSITPDDLRQVRFAQARKGGYETEAVDRALDTIADSVDVMIQERAQLIERIRVLEGDLDRLQAEGPSGQPLPAVASSSQDSTMVELLGETRAIRSLLQAIVTQGGGLSGAPPAS